MKPHHSLLLVLLAFILSYSVTAQPVMLENAAKDATHIVVYGSGNLAKQLSYEQVRGNAYWNDEWKRATLIDQDNKVITNMKIKLNLYTNDIHFINSAGKEMVAVRDAVRKIVFHKSDNANDVLAVFENNVDPIVENNVKAENSSYVQVLNYGDIQLLKHNRKMLNSADSLFGTMKRYHFSDQAIYYINQKGGSLTRLKKLSKDNLMNTFPEFTSGIYNECISYNKINFKKEEDVIRFLEYYNSSVKEKKGNN